MSNILNNNRIPLECKLSTKDYWDFCLMVGREYYGYTEGVTTKCLSAYIDTTIRECVNRNGSLDSCKQYSYENCVNDGVVLNNIGLTAMDNGFIVYDKDISESDFEFLLERKHKIEKDDCRLHVYPVNGNHDITYDNKIVNFNGVTCSKLNGGFYQGFFRVGNGCAYSILPSEIGSGLSFEFELYRKNFESEGKTLNSMSDDKNKGIFFYIGAREENKWIRYYGNFCDEAETKIEETELKTFDGIPIGERTGKFVETYNKYLIYNRTCDGKTVYTDDSEPYDYRLAYVYGKEKALENSKDVHIYDIYFEGDNAWKEDNTIAVETTVAPYPDNLFTVFNRTCDGITTQNFTEKYLKEKGIWKYNPYMDLWNNALAFMITEDNRVGYKYLVKDCESKNPNCSYKIESEFSNENNVPYSEWVTIHVKVLPVDGKSMRLMFYVNGRLVLFSKALPILLLRELNDIPEKQEGIPFNISIGGGTQGLADVVYEDYKSFFKTNFPLQKEFGGSFIGYLKSFKFYSCPLNFNQIRQNVDKKIEMHNDKKTYCGAIIFNEKPSKITINEQASLIPILNSFSSDTYTLEIKMLPDISKKYVRLIVAVPSESELMFNSAYTTVSGMGEEKKEITQFFSEKTTLQIENSEYNVWYCSYASPTMINNTITINLTK